MENYASQVLLYFFAFLIIILIIFWAGREVVCWYWKINEGLQLLTEIRNLLREQVRQPASPESNNRTATAASGASERLKPRLDANYAKVVETLKSANYQIFESPWNGPEGHNTRWQIISPTTGSEYFYERSQFEKRLEVLLRSLTEK